MFVAQKRTLIGRATRCVTVAQSINRSKARAILNFDHAVEVVPSWSWARRFDSTFIVFAELKTAGSSQIAAPPPALTGLSALLKSSSSVVSSGAGDGFS